MTKEELSALIREVGLGHIEETLMQAAQPSLRLHLHPVDEDTIPIGGTKFGGGADLPPGFEWPVWQGYPESDRLRYPPGEFRYEDGAQDFLLQLRLEDLAAYDLGGILPTSGILYFFCATWKAALGSDETDHDCWKVFYYDGDLSKLARRLPPSPGSRQDGLVYGAAEDALLTCCRIEFQPDLTLPAPNDPVTFNPLGIAWDTENAETDYLRYWALMDLPDETDHLRYSDLMGPRDEPGLRDDKPIHHLLGLPQIVQYDRIVGADFVDGHNQEWCLLLQLDSDESVGLDWQGGGRGYFYIPTQALAERNFDAVWVDMQCT